MISRRRYMGGVKKLPYDAEVEWLGAINGQYIDTGIVPNDSYSINVDFMFSDNGNGNAIFSTRYSSKFRNIDLYIWINSNKQKFNNNYNSNTFGGLAEAGVLYNYDLTNGIITVKDKTNDVIVTNFDGNARRPFTTPYSICIFAIHGSTIDAGSNWSLRRIYNFLIKDDSNQVVFDAIPVRVGQVGYLHDRLSGQLFGNEGTGAFIVGPDK